MEDLQTRTETKTTTKKATAAKIHVEVAILGEEVKSFKVPKGTTIDAVLKKAGVGNPEDQKEGIKVNGRDLPFRTPLKENDFITVTPRVRGGWRCHRYQV